MKNTDVNTMHTESRIQQDIFLWHYNNHPHERKLLFHVPNENQHRGYNIGVVGGVSDLILLKNKTAYLIEVKTLKGKQSPKQKEWESLTTKNGFKYVIVRSLQEFKEFYASI